MRYQLMNKDTVVAVYEEHCEWDEYTYELISQEDDYLPYGFVSINDWIDGRQIAKRRNSINELLVSLGIADRHNFIDATRCLSLTDTFWMKSEEDDLLWDEVSLYANKFDDEIAKIAFDSTGEYGKQASLISPEYATSGSFAKCWLREDSQISLLKRGSAGRANAGFEPYSEKLASDLLDAAKVNHVPYELVNYHEKLASKCPLFTNEEIGFVAAQRFFETSFGIKDMIDLSRKHGVEERFREMVVMDAVMANIDRHAGNYGFLVNNTNGSILDFAPLFDHNMACLPMMMTHDDFDEYVSKIGPKIGNDFTAVAKAMITSDIKAKLISLKDYEYLDPGFDYPRWKLDTANKFKSKQIDSILGTSMYICSTIP